MRPTLSIYAMVVEPKGAFINLRDHRSAGVAHRLKLFSLSCFAIGFLALACTPNAEVLESVSSQKQSLDCPHGPTGELQWNTFMGSNGTHYGNTVKATAQGVYACGMSNTSWGNPVRPFGDGNWEAFIARLNPTSGAFVWNTFLGQVSAASDHCQGMLMAVLMAVLTRAKQPTPVAITIFLPSNIVSVVAVRLIREQLRF
jgi:hypothetical protein